MKKTILLTAAASIAAAANLLAGPAGDIAAKHAAVSAVELEAYLKANPDAEDSAEAIDHLLGAYALTGNSKRSAELLQTKFDAIEGGAGLNPQELFMTIQMLFSILLETGDKEGAKKVITTAIEKAKGHQAGPQLEQSFTQMSGSLNQPGVGDTMDIKFTSVQGEEIDLSKMTGKVVLVDFWATWCGPCVAELPHVKEAYEQFHDKGFEVVAISLDREKDALTSFIKEKEMPWPQHFDGQGEFANKFSISGIPATFLIGADGKIVATNLRGDALGKAVAEHLGPAEKEAPAAE